VPVPNLKQTKIDALNAWEKQGLTAANAAQLPMAIVTTDSAFVDRTFVYDLTAMLGKSFHIVDRSAAALVFQLSDLKGTGRPLGLEECDEDKTQSKHELIKSLNVRAEWSNGHTFLSAQKITAKAILCLDSDADHEARDQLIKNARDFISKSAR
jgi:hypothetical protein